jgi:predicted membrane protein
MKQATKLVLALALIAAGVLWILTITNVLTITFSTKGWWALFVIVPSFFGLINDKDKVGPCFGIGVGVLLLLAARGVITWNMMWQIALALMVIGFGVKLLFFKSFCHGQCEVRDLKTISRNGKNIRRIESAFGKQQISFAGETFEGAEVQSSFGGLTLDLNGAVIPDDAFIELSVGFSGVVIIVPENLAVEVSVSSGFGGVNDNRRFKPSTGSPRIILTGSVGFGGVEIRN